mgnify:FL=1
MTKGDRDKLRAELAGKAMAALLIHDDNSVVSGWSLVRMARHSVDAADALMAELGIKEEE